MASVCLVFDSRPRVLVDTDTEMIDPDEPTGRHLSPSDLGQDPDAFDDLVFVTIDGRPYTPAGKHPICGTWRFLPRELVRRMLDAPPDQLEMFG